MTQETNNTGYKEPRIVRGRVDSLSLYEITDNELDILEKGSPNSLFLNFAIFLLSIGISFLSTLITVDIESTRIFVVYVILSAVGILIGLFLLIIWYKMKHEVSDVVKKIKRRIAEQESTTTSAEQESTCGPSDPT